MHLATRRVLAASCTEEPNEAWVTQQAKNLTWKLEDDGIKLSATRRFLNARLVLGINLWA